MIDKIEEVLRATPDLTSTNPDDYIDPDSLNSVLDDVEQGYRTIAAIRDEQGCVNVDIPIVTHTYDYATPRNALARFLFAGIVGPWLFPAFESRGIAKGVREPIVDRLIDVMANRLLSLATGPTALRNLHVVDTRNSLVPAGLDDTGNSNDWLNEIHPNLGGYRKIAAKLGLAVDPLIS